MSILPSRIGPAAAAWVLGLASLALLAPPRAARGKSPPESLETQPPAAMSAEEFGRLSAAEQRSLLVRAFERRVEHARNLHYESDEVIKSYQLRGGKPGEPQERSARSRFRHWLLGDSFRADRDDYHAPSDPQPSRLSTSAVNAEEGLGRDSSVEKDGQQPQGWVRYPAPEYLHLSRYYRWIADKDCTKMLGHPGVGPGESLFPYLLGHREQFTIEATVEGGQVRLTVPWQQWAIGPVGKRVFRLDPRKGFLPVRCDSRCESPSTEKERYWSEETIVVEESRPVGDIWMPIKLRETYATSTFPDLITVLETKALRVELGAVKPSDIQVPFPEGMKVIDAVEGVEYVAGAQGKPAGPAKFARGWKNRPPEGWHRREPATIPSMASRLSAADREMLRKDEEEKRARREALEAALALLRSGPPTPIDERVAAGLTVLRTYRIGENEAIWAAAIRELITIGKAAIPQLTEELDRTEREESLRALGFVLRGIGDPRAAPAMVRAIPRFLQPSHSDYGLLIENDPGLLQFMREHDKDKGKSEHFSYCRPIQEIMSALEKMTGETLGWKELNFLQLGGSPEQQRIQRTLNLQLAERWADWWSKNWRNHVERQADAQLDRTRQALDRYAESIAAMPHEPRTTFPCGPKVILGGGAQNGLIHAFDESRSGAFVDLDTGRWPVPPKDLVKRCTDHKPSEELLAWAEREGVDWIYVTVTPPGGEPYHAIQPVGMKLWRIANDRFDHLQDELRQSQSLALPAPWEGPLVQTGEQGGGDGTNAAASFLFITREGSCGALRIRGLLRPAASGSDRGNSAPPAASADEGVLYEFIYEGDGKEE